MKKERIEKLWMVVSLSAFLVYGTLQFLDVEVDRLISLFLQLLIFSSCLLGLKEQNSAYKAWKEKWRTASPEELALLQKERRWNLFMISALVGTGAFLILISALVG